ncbi:MAG TPA: histone [Candidatus Deferrimicrobium sp.]|nr:histone [Candidatus Deferrimicrobium sp.]
MPREKTERIIPLAPLDRLIRKAKAERVSEKAAMAMGEILEEVGIEIAAMARDLAEHAHRKTINGNDIRLAYKQWRRKT